jgi:hypothetical protein
MWLQFELAVAERLWAQQRHGVVDCFERLVFTFMALSADEHAIATRIHVAHTFKHYLGILTAAGLHEKHLLGTILKLGHNPRRRCGAAASPASRGNSRRSRIKA